MVFQLVPTLLTLNDVIALILLYFTELDSFALIMSQWLKIDL